MNLLKIIINWLKLIKQGASLKDKSIISFYLLNIPVYKLFKILNSPLIGNVTIKSEDGVFFCGDKISSAWTGSNLYEIESRPYFKLDKGNFIDVGANIGKFSVIVARDLGGKGKVLAIEPHPETFNILKKNIQLNKLKNVEVINAACSSSESYLDLYLDERGTLGHSIKKNSRSAGEKTIRVRGILLDNCKIKNVKLIKIDVEGAEADVLKGAKKILKRDHPRVIFEAWDRKFLNTVKNVLSPFKYQIKNIGETNYLAY